MKEHNDITKRLIEIASKVFTETLKKIQKEEDEERLRKSRFIRHQISKLGL